MLFIRGLFVCRRSLPFLALGAPRLSTRAASYLLR
jgi:hypothetical protein